MTRPIIIEAPSTLGLDGAGVGVAGLSQALLAAGLAGRLQATVTARVEAPASTPGRHPEHGLLNADALARYSRTLADEVGASLERREFPVVLGGDCTILLGNLLALRRRGRFGLLFVDGHADFYQPEANINGEGASSELAFATGRGPSVVTQFDGRESLIADDDVVVFGYRDGDEQRQFGSQPLPAGIKAFDLAELRRSGVETPLREAIRHVTRPELDGFWIHFDADVLDDALMPAVKYHLPGGFSWAEMRTVLQTALATGRAVGLEVTIYDPSLDPTGDSARALVDTIAEGFAS